MTIMKHSYLFAALCVVIAAASCAKEVQTQNEANPAEGLTITCTFEANEATKSTPVATETGLAPRWQAGDKIKVYGFKDGDEAGNIVIELADKDILDGGKKFRFTLPAKWDLGLDDFIYAMYPASAMTGVQHGAGEYGKIFFDIPAEQDGTFASANICGAKAPIYEPQLRFKNLTTVFRVIAPSSQYTKLTLSHAMGGNLCGSSYAYNIDGTMGVYTSEGSSSVSVDINSPEVYFTVSPTTGYLTSGSTLTFDPVPGVKSQTIEITRNNKLSKGLYYNLGCPVEDDFIPAVFSVSAGKKVLFSKGNFWFNPQSDPMVAGFEETQYVLGGIFDTPLSRIQSDHNHLFHWYSDIKRAALYVSSTRAEDHTSLFTNDPDNCAKANSKFAVNGKTGIWRVLTGGPDGEWDYLLNKRIVNGGTGEGKSFQRATINSDGEGVFGMIIYPDNYIAQTGDDSYTAEQWTAMESSGCVFLAASGSGTINGCIEERNEVGWYWSSTLTVAEDRENLFSYCLCFSNDAVEESAITHDRTVSIRLVME